MRTFFDYRDQEESKRSKQSIILFALVMMLFWGIVSCLAAWQVAKILGVSGAIEEEKTPTEETYENKTPADLPLGEIYTNSIGMQLRLVQPGTFRMGSLEDEVGHRSNESPVRTVNITNPFYMGIYEVTQEQWFAVMNTNPSKYIDPKKPVEQISWEDIQNFLKKLSQKENVRYRLPTEAEWEYVCRAGTDTAYPWGLTCDTDYAWYRANSSDKTQEVGTKKPNRWGFFDMIGNVWEWCQDWCDTYPSMPEDIDPQGPRNGQKKVIRGGGWYRLPEDCRSAVRLSFEPRFWGADIGFRVVREP